MESESTKLMEFKSSFTIDKEAKMIYVNLNLNKKKVVKTRPVKANLDYGEDGSIVGIEVFLADGKN